MMEKTASSTTSTTAASRRALCQHKDCAKFAQTRGLCKAHGGGTRCKVPSCVKLAQSRGHCIAHGGGRKCQIEDCEKLAQSKGYCIAHGGGRKCVGVAMAGCQKFSQIKGKCKAHAKSSPEDAIDATPTVTPLVHAKVLALRDKTTLVPLKPTHAVPTTTPPPTIAAKSISLSPLREYVRRAEPTTCSFAALFTPLKTRHQPPPNA
ncbi:Aste57867_13549 [Aphanomyces stellatus]|uniref:Aste57867_13549 protein n=1 Tax=Aphanomyces stellatus TaxID=120398 RepID=A0A485KZA3_9STRA|nr:hypothetical protein As57867_013499 [Aphanomyces stellatus]VFT90387.1 Aste57867_13549 [Aphanomyces stellatus]